MIIRVLRKVTDFLFLMRPIVLVSVWGFSIFGYRCGLLHKNESVHPIVWGKEHVVPFLYMILFSISVGAVFVLNQIADFSVDAHNDGFPLLVKGKIGMKTARQYAVILIAASILLPLISTIPVIAVFSVGSLALGIMYCFKPFYFTGRPFFDFLANAVGYALIAFGVGWYLYTKESLVRMDFVLAALPYFFLMCAGSISSTLPDYSGDKVENKRTTAVTFGITPAHSIASLFLVSAGITAWYSHDIIPVIVSISAVPFYGIFFFCKSQTIMEATYKIGGGISMVLAGILFPLLIPAALIVMFGTRIYFRHRYGVSYPSLIPIAQEASK